MQTFQVIPGLLIGTRLASTAAYGTLGVDAIVDLEHWDQAWAPAVPDGSIHLSFPLEDGERVDPKVREVAAFTAALVRSGRRVLVHCTEGLNRAGVVVARTLMELGRTAEEAIALVREERGVTEDGFTALSNERFVDWLLAEAPRAGR